jgi:predicted metal-dependent phosphoesterase TrpH
MARIDLQSHSLNSDGALPAAAVVAAAAAAGVELLALSDHDTVGGIDEALAAAREHSIALLTATEISAVDAGYEDLHVLGYGIDQHDPLLLERLADARADRGRRAERMIARLRELGFAIDETSLDLRRAQGKPIGRPHLAAAVLAHPDNAARLASEGHSDVSSFIPAYVIPGAPAYSGRTRPTVAEAIEWIHAAGGLAVWAHPFWDIKDDGAVLEAIDRYRGAGLNGVECFYVTHDERQTQRLLSSRCEELGLIATASSDYHGPEHRLFSRFLAYELYGLEPRLGVLDSDRFTMYPH